MGVLGSRHATLRDADEARRRQREGSLRWRVELTDHDAYPWALVHYRFCEEVPTMTPRLQPGAIRDALAAASEHNRGDQPFTWRALQGRLGLSPQVANARVEGMAARGLLEIADERADPVQYRISAQGQAMLDA